MSIATRTGDKGTTGLLFNRRVPKFHARVEAGGALDELNAALGMVRAHAGPGPLEERVQDLQQDLIVLMGEVATEPADTERYDASGFQHVSPSMTAVLDGLIQTMEQGGETIQDWAIPGAGLVSASLDVARTICRRAERRVCELEAENLVTNHEIAVYLNRLSDTLWLLARELEKANHAA